MGNKKEYFVLFANCIPVKGNKRSVICDLHRQELKLIPNNLFDILTQYKNSRIDEIKRNYDNKFNETIDEYFNFLLENELGFYTNLPHSFPELNLKWNSPALITNAILDIDFNSNYNLENVFTELDKLTCKHIQLRFFSSISFCKLKKILSILNKEDYCIISVDLILKFTDDLTIESLNKLILDMPRITSLIIYKSTDNVHVKPVRSSLNHFIYTTESIKNHKFCGIVNGNYFSINIKNFTESQKYNSCLNRKISIDTEGNIKNCPSVSQSFGNIKDTSLQKALEHKDFKKYWNITKDQIDVCKDCEFRYICTDCRAYTENPEDHYSKPLKCGYNPYTNVWEEWSTNPLKEKAIEYYGMQELVKNNG
ncbi:grasp-with-spasm system SPASM domain peptide maturase [Bizionia sp.]|uniref:grasp-with-spasm system SPASM domain peptide maturase n=1 Tax=Bizionia sp. TaxID=1954480 RepID=UPI003A907D79